MNSSMFLSSIRSESARTEQSRPTIIGIYGVPGCGKTHLLRELKAELDQNFGFYEGSIILDKLVPGGLEAFKRLPNGEKVICRQDAIAQIASECTSSGKIGVVAGHLMFWDNEGDAAGQNVWTDGDASVYTHIIYFNVSPVQVVQRRANDSSRNRTTVSETHIQKWQQAEIEQLRPICRQNQIVFAVASENQVGALVQGIRQTAKAQNLAHAEGLLHEIVAGFKGANTNNSAILVLDGDKTLIAGDSCAEFWEMGSGSDPLKALFSSPMGYSHQAFVQAAILYGGIDEKVFGDVCEKVASKTRIREEMQSLLNQAAKRGIGAIVVTCGLRLVWEKIIEAVGLSNLVKVIGSGRIQDERKVIVTPLVKRKIIARLQNFHRLAVCAFGDSVLDVPMMSEAATAIVVVGDEKTRSKSMESRLRDAIVNFDLQAHQCLLPGTVRPRLDTNLLPVVDITRPDFLDAVLRELSFRRVLHATEEQWAKLLMTPMRDADVAGPALQKAHRAVGQNLATILLPKLLGLEETSIRHVQGKPTTGHRIFKADKIVIVALMRGGEPMAAGVFNALPLAMFVHAKNPEDIKREHLDGRETVLLVDSVVNTGKSIDEFMRHIRAVSPLVRVVVIAGVVQVESLSTGVMGDILASDGKVGVVALRISQNKYTGKGTTDTGHRLFNTTHMD